MEQVRAFSDELGKIAGTSKCANLSMLKAPPPPTGLGEVKTKTPKKSTITSAPSAYSKVHSVPTPSPSAGYQPTAAAPPVKG